VKPAPIVLINVGHKVIVSLSKMFREVAVVTRGVVVLLSGWQTLTEQDTDKEQADVNASQADKKSIYEEAREATLGGAGTSRDNIMLPSEIVSLLERRWTGVSQVWQRDN